MNFPVLAATLAAALTLAAPAWAQKVKLATSMGDIVIELAPDKSPKTVARVAARTGKFMGILRLEGLDAGASR